MVWLVFMILLVLWLLGFVSDYTFGGLLHVLLIAAAGTIIIGIFGGKRPLV